MTLRPVTLDDQEFLREVYAAARKEELDQVAWPSGQREAFIAQQFAAQDRDYHARYPDQAFLIIERDGEPIGRLYRWHGEHSVHVVDIALVPEWRGRGIGTALMRSLMAEARDAGVDCTLYVERFNPALRLYQRLGFEVAEDGPVYLFLRWRTEPVS